MMVPTQGHWTTARMGDRYDRKDGQPGLRAGLGAELMRRRGKPPPTLVAWGLGELAQIGHNNGPPLDDDTPGYVWRRYRWTKVHAAVWKTPPMGILKFRLARAAAAGLSYRDYMLTLLDTGRFAQARDRDVMRQSGLEAIRAAWADLMPRVAPQSMKMQRALVLSSLIAAYDDETRGYHNVTHIGAMLRDLKTYGADCQHGDALRLAILFHDAVYDATKTDNEAASAALARLHLTDLGVAADLIAMVERMILATRHRAEDVAMADADTALLLDLDLAVLAAPEDRYHAYAAGVRREYSHVPDDAWRTGRTRVLQSFLQRSSIYLTPALAALWETDARANLTGEIAALAAKS